MTQQEIVDYYPNTYDRSLPLDAAYGQNGSKIVPPSWEQVYGQENLGSNSTLVAVTASYPYALSMPSEDHLMGQDCHPSVAPIQAPASAYPGYYPVPENGVGDSEAEVSMGHHPMAGVGPSHTSPVITPSGLNGFNSAVGMYIPNASSATSSNLYYAQQMASAYSTPQTCEQHLPAVGPTASMPGDYCPFPQTTIANSFPMIDYRGECLGMPSEEPGGVSGHPAMHPEHYWIGGNQIVGPGSNFTPAVSHPAEPMDQVEHLEKMEETGVTYGGGSVFGCAMRNSEENESLFIPRIHSTLSCDSRNNQFSVTLQNQKMWYDFYQNQTEMIITKTGRRMFPYLSIDVFGLDDNKQYNVFVDVQQICNQTLKYHSGRWVPNGEGEPWPPTGSVRGRIYMHPDSPNSGRHWMKQEIQFMKLKLTNNKVVSEEDDGKMIVVNSMHNYIPRINFVEVDSPTMNKFFAVATFPVTEFIVVTAYQNTEVTELKIKYNPFAKGFRETNKATNGRGSASNKLILSLCQPSEPRENSLYYLSPMNQQADSSPSYIQGVHIINMLTDSTNQQQVKPKNLLQEYPNNQQQQLEQSSLQDQEQGQQKQNPEYQPQLEDRQKTTQTHQQVLFSQEMGDQQQLTQFQCQLNDQQKQKFDQEQDPQHQGQTLGQQPHFQQLMDQNQKLPTLQEEKHSNGDLHHHQQNLGRHSELLQQG